MVGWHYWPNGHECEWTPGVGDGQGSLACCSPWARKESDTTELNWTEGLGTNRHWSPAGLVLVLVLLLLTFVDWRKMHNLKVENCVFFGGLSEDPCLEDSLCDGSEGLLWRCKGGARICEFLQQGPGSQIIKRSLLIKESKTSQVYEFSAFLCMLCGKSPDSLK